MRSTLKILGLGRCPIGLLRKNILKDAASAPDSHKTQIIFDHHYILNPATCTQMSHAKSSKHSLSMYQSKPTFADQLFCLEQVKEYQVCVIEIFAPSRLYVNNHLELYACFESLTKELEECGFIADDNHPAGRLDHTDPHSYLTQLKKLIDTIRNDNESLPIILLNADLLHDQKGNKLSSPILHPIMEGVRRDIIPRYDHISLLDINSTLDRLSAKKICYYDTEFPLLYIRHSPDLKPIEISRDCKHASPLLRKHFTQAFYNNLMQLGYSFPNLGLCIPNGIPLSEDYHVRAQTFLDSHNRKKGFNSLFENSRILSQYVQYVLDTDDKEGHSVLKRYINRLSSDLVLTSGRALVTYLYHIRTLTAYLYATKRPQLSSLCLIGIRILDMPKEVHQEYAAYVLLWLKNLCLAAREILQSDPHISPQPLHLFLGKLTSKSYLHTHEIIRQLLGFKNDFSKKPDSGASNSSLRKIKKIALFLPRTNPFYLTMYFGMKRGFEQQGIEVCGWTELLEEQSLLEFCRQFKPDAIFEMNRSRRLVPSLPSDIPHICWVVDLMGNDFHYFQGSDILYTFAAFWPQNLTETIDNYIDWLPPGIDPIIYHPKKQNFEVDFTFIGHIPMPWNQEELSRPLYQHDSNGKKFSDYIESYDSLWKTALSQPTPPEILHRIMGRYDMLHKGDQEIDIDDLTLRYDILCRSRRMNIRKLIIDTVTPVSDSIAIYGPENWKQWPQYTEFHHHFVEDPHQLRHIYQTSRMNLHEGVGLHMRSLDCLGSGGCLLNIKVDKRNNSGDGLKFHFENNVHYLELDQEDREYQLRHLLADDERIRAIGAQGAKLAHAKHTWSERAKKIIADIQFIRS